MAEVERLTDSALLGEGPCWHAEEKVLYWVDILGKNLHRYDPLSKTDHTWQFDQTVGTVAPRTSGGLLLALRHGFAFFDSSSGKIEQLAPVEPNLKTRFNDGKCDPRGRFWCGTMDLQEKESIGNFYRMDANQAITKIASNIGVSNGMGWSPDHSTMYYIDSPTRCVFSFDYDLETGDVANRRVALELSEDQGYPDGMTVDNEGMIWLAHWGAARICRWSPTTGTVLERYDTPAPHTSACCFGGKDLSDLYITTARDGLTDTQLEDFPESGCLFRLKTSVCGSPTFAYAG
ncbi:MAG: SMP-30/gluconolactonase/LRE family protein [Pirellulales bacterium]